MADETFEVELRIDLNAPNLSAELSRALGGLNNSVTGFDDKIGKVQKSLNGTAAATKNLTQNLSTSRYALYDVSSTLGIMGAALAGAAVGTSAVAIAWERDFAQVQRTTGVTGAGVGKLRDQIVDLAQTMPVAFGDLAQIATLGGQLGVAEGNIASFTETVAKFSAVTDLSVDAAATAFGRLDALLPDVDGNFDALGSSIAKVGVNSVATESQIVNIATQISSMGAFAGLTADQVVGLSGALASVGAAPELSRGTVTRLFTEMSEAVSEGGDKLEGFAKVAGVSSAQFAESFGTARFGPVFQSFVEGLNDTTRNGGNAVAMLDELGIKSVRDVPLLLRLAGAGQLLGDSFDDAADGFQNATELNRQYGIIADTASAQIQRLINSVLSLFDSIGRANLGPITDSISFLADAFANLTDFADSDFGQWLVGNVAVLTVFAGVLSLAGAALALFGASSIGMAQGLSAIVAMAPRASAAILGAGTASSIASGQMTAASVSAKLLGTALKALSLVGIALILPDLANWLDDGIRGVQGLSNEFEAMKKRVQGSNFSGDLFLGGDITKFDASFQAIGRSLGDVANRGYGDIKRLDEAMAELANNGNVQTARQEYESLQETWTKAGGSVDAFKAAFIDTTAALDGSRNATNASEGAFATLEEGMSALEGEAQQTEQAINELKDAILNLNSTSISAEQASINMQRALNDMATAAANGEATLSGTNQASLDLRQSFIDVNKAALDGAVAVAENTGSIDLATEAYLAGREAIVQARVAKGEDEAAARAWADTIFGSSAEAQAAVQAYINKTNEVPQVKTTHFYVDASGAYRSTQQLIDWIQSRRPTLTITEVLVTASAIQSGGRGRLVPGAATGGHITGPGTGTSDSILARLSNNEFVMKAAAVQKYGTEFMHAINSGRLPKFASGGSVNAAGGGGSSMMGGVIELGPKSLAAVSRSVINNILLDDDAISRSAERGNANRRSTGEL